MKICMCLLHSIEIIMYNGIVHACVFRVFAAAGHGSQNHLLNDAAHQ